jgi:hypothetical protein
MISTQLGRIQSDELIKIIALVGKELGRRERTRRKYDRAKQRLQARCVVVCENASARLWRTNNEKKLNEFFLETHRGPASVPDVIRHGAQVRAHGKNQVKSSDRQCFRSLDTKPPKNGTNGGVTGAPPGRTRSGAVCREVDVKCQRKNFTNLTVRGILSPSAAQRLT